MAKKAAKYRVQTFRGNDARYYWHIRRNGRIVVVSEGYNSKRSRDTVAKHMHEALSQGTNATLEEIDYDPRPGQRTALQ